MIGVAAPRGWYEAPLGKIAEIERRSVLPKDIRPGTKYVGLEHLGSDGHILEILTVGNGELASNKFVFGPHHILYGKLRPYLRKIVRPHFEGICSTDILPIRATGVNRGYLYHYLRHPRMVECATTRCEGANLPRLNPSELERFPIHFPPSETEQQRIADILDKADAILQKRRDASSLLAKLMASVFLDLFGEPVRNPKRWKLSTFGNELADLEYGPRFYNEPYSPDGIRIVRITDLDAYGNLDFDSMPRMVVDTETRKARSLKPGDVIIARSGATVGKTAIIEPDDPESIAGAYFIRLRFKPTVLPLFAKMVLDSPLVQKIIATNSRQSAQQNFSGPGIRALPLPIPPPELQEQLGRFRCRVKHAQRKYRRGLEEAKSLFDSLTQRAFRGELS